MKLPTWRHALRFLMVFLFTVMSWDVLADICAVCGQPILTRSYLYTDKVLKQKVLLCYDCSEIDDLCFACGLPVKSGSRHLSDGRFYCSRDEKTAMLNLEEAQQVAKDVKESLDRLFARFTDFPTNLSVAIMDRVDLLEFKVPGNDYVCPNIMGLHYNRTNDGPVTHEIKILSGLTRSALKSTCAHEYTHAWVKDNVPAERRKRLGRDAEEGFCELVSYLLMDAQQDEKGKEDILANAYTRGQIDFFVRAEKKFGFNDVLDWVKFGVAEELNENPEVVRDVKFPSVIRPAFTNVAVYSVSPTAAPNTLTLKGISWSKNQPWALINNQSFTTGESGKVRLGQTNVAICCLAIRADSVRVRLIDSGEERELTLNSEKAGRR